MRSTRKSQPQRTTMRRALLRPLGIVGYDAIEPAILAALATQEPLLLVSEHGAAKTLLLVRLAEALGLTLRHYNASILQFDDLAGFPIPDDAGTIRYAAPPGAIWDADVAFFDEIGRCRPDVANKLFPIIQERRIQGVPITRLTHRWAATNPPAEAQEADARFAYDGVDVLDPALADRFAWIVSVPRFDELSDADRRAIISGAGERVDPAAAAAVRELVETTRAFLPGVRERDGEAIAAYVDVLVSKLAAAHVSVGGRRAATLFRNVIAMRAAHLALGLAGDAHACRAALLSSVPDVVRRRIPRATLLAAHEAAWKQVTLEDDDPSRALLAVRDPLQRALLALTLPTLGSRQRGEALCGALAELAPLDRHVAAWCVMPHLVAEPLVPLTALETVAGLVQGIAMDGVTLTGYVHHRAWAVAVRSALALAQLPIRDADYLHGAILAHGVPPSSVPLAQWPSAQSVVDHALALRSTCHATLGRVEQAA